MNKEIRIGVHTSISGGVQNAVVDQVEKGGNCGQIFSHSPQSWDQPSVSEEEQDEFQNLCSEKDIRPWVIHASYLVNLCTPKDDLGRKSTQSMQDEVNVASELGIPYVNVHLGAHTGAGVSDGLKNAAERIDSLDVPDDVTVVVESDAGSGTKLGGDFSHLQKVDELTDSHIEFCLDTAHAWAAGYDFSTADGAQDVFAEFDDVVGLEKLSIIHLNDSKHDIGTNKDEHQHLGDGMIGYKGIREVIRIGGEMEIPFIAETPITEEKGDEQNIDLVRDVWSDYSLDSS